MEVKNKTISCKGTERLLVMLEKSAAKNDVRLSTEVFNRLIASFKGTQK